MTHPTVREHDQPMLIPLKTAARQIGISYQFLHLAAQAEVITTVRMGVKILISRDEITRIACEGIPPFSHPGKKK